MYNAHGQSDKNSKEYPVRKRYEFESSASYNKRVNLNSLIVFAIFILVIIGAVKFLF